MLPKTGRENCHCQETRGQRRYISEGGGTAVGCCYLSWWVPKVGSTESAEALHPPMDVLPYHHTGLKRTQQSHLLGLETALPIMRPKGGSFYHGSHLTQDALGRYKKPLQWCVSVEEVAGRKPLWWCNGWEDAPVCLRSCKGVPPA